MKKTTERRPYQKPTVREYGTVAKVVQTDGELCWVPPCTS